MKNIKIGIMTFHRAINYGALLQCYSLNKFINSNYDNIDCKVIDYFCEQFKKDYRLLKIYNSNLSGIVTSILKFPYRFSKRYKFRKFLNDNVKLSTKKYSKNNISEISNQYDILLTGSDQIWNIELTNYDYNYFLDFSSVANKNSYAASFGNDDILMNKKEDIIKKLSTFNNISLREKKHVNILSKMLKKDVVKGVDPVFLNDIIFWKKLISSRIIKDKYIFVYALHELEVYEIASRLSNLTGYKIIAVTDSLKKYSKGKYIRNAGIEEFLNYIFYAEYVVTDSFHGTAFSLIFNKNLRVVYKKERMYLNERIKSILTSINMEKEIVVNMNNDDDELLKNIDYSNYDKNISKLLNSSKEYLDRIIMRK